MEEQSLIDSVENVESEPMTGIRRIHIENVQSISELTIDLDRKGVYRLVGDNEIGKSAILRGVNALFNNVSRSSYKEYISDWATSFVVEAWFYDGGYVKLSRGADDYYEWSLPNGDSNTLLKTDGKVPKELEDYFNLYYEKDKTKRTLNFNLQGDILPFVDTSASDNFWLTQNALGTNILLNASKILKTETKDFNKEIKTIIDNVDYEEQLSSKILNEIENDEHHLMAIKEGIDVINEEYSELKEIEELYKKETEIKLFEYNYNQINLLSTTEINKLNIKISELSVMEKYLDSLVSTSKLIEDVNSLTETIANNNIDDLDTKVKEYTLLKDLNTKWVDVNNLDNKLNSINVIDTVIINEIEEESKTISNLDEHLNSMKKILSVQEEIEHLENVQISQLNSVIESVSKEIEELLEQEKVCPICGNDLTQNKIHTHKD